MSQPKKRTAAASKPVAEADRPAPSSNAVATRQARLHSIYFLALVSIGVALIITFCFCPRYVLWRGVVFTPACYTAEAGRAHSTIEQIKDPFAPVQRDSDRVIAWRILLPLIWYSLSLPISVYLILPHLGCLATLGLIAYLVHQRTGDRRQTLLATIVMGASTWFFVSSGWLTYFDSWVIGGLILLTFSNARWLLAVLCLVIPWIDERFLMAVPLCLVARSVVVVGTERRSLKTLVIDAAAILIPCLVYPGLRIWLMSKGVSQTELNGYARDNFTLAQWLSVSPFRYAEGAWAGVRAAWVYIGLLLWLLWSERLRLQGLLLAAVLVVTVFIALLVAGDLDRSVSIVAPLALLGILELARQKPDVLRKTLPWVAGASLLLPASHVLTGFKTPIFYLYTEMDRWQHPPAEFCPEFYVQQGIECDDAGQYDEAATKYAWALELDPHHVPAYVARCLMRTRRGDVRGAMEDAQTAIDLDPKEPEAYFARAFARIRQKDWGGAQSDLQTALQLAPAGWHRAKELQEMLLQVNQNVPAATPKR
jgi:tetratricopeptide (TPR) repeat protein